MKNLWWKTVGEGNYHLVMLHGWGLNAEVWCCIQKELASLFILHLVDLPGFGRSHGYGALLLDEMAQCVLECAPEKAIWLGWSLGGLIASQVALTHPERVQALVTVTSSPCFGARKAWPGLKLEVLTSFQRKLSDDFQRTIERFLTLQTMGVETARQDARILRQVIFDLPLPSEEVLNGSLEILKTADLREKLITLQLPHLRLYGYLDSLVPHKITSLLDIMWPRSESIVITRAAHAPFISHPAEFCAALTELNQRLS